MRTQTQMAFFQPKNNVTIRKNKDKIMQLNNNNSNLNSYKISSKIIDQSEIMTKYIGKKKNAKKNNASKFESIPKLSQSHEKRKENNNNDNKNKFLISNINFFKRNMNNMLRMNHTNDNSILSDIRKNKYYLKYKYNNPHNDIQYSYSLPKIQVMKNPIHISLDKEEKLFKEKKANSQRNILNFKNSSKIMFKLKENKFTNDKLNEDISLAAILNENFINYQKAKHSENGFDRIISYGVNTYKGVIRNYNEDRVTILINALINKGDNNSKKFLRNLKISYFSIYDGHAGNKCCEFLKKYLHHYIFESEFFPLNPIKALEDGFNLCENKFMSLIHSDKNYIDSSGSCALVILILNDVCYIANLGDSRALYSCNDGKKFFQITRDHKPNDNIEKDRIYKAGGSIYKTLNNSPNKNQVNGKERLDRISKIPYRINPGHLAVSHF